MNLGALIRHAWRITSRNRTLWALSGLMFLAALPAAAVTGGMGWVAGEYSFAGAGLEPEWLIEMRAWPVWQWVLVWLLAVAALIAASSLTYVLQAATVRGVTLAAEREAPVAFREALSLGRARVLRLIRLSLTLGATLTALNLLPVLGRLMLGDDLNVLGGALLSLGQSSLSLLLSVASLALFLMVLAIAVEDVHARQAARRAWAVFRWGWWAFALVLLLSAAPVAVLVVLAMPLVLVMPLAVVNPKLGIIVGLVGCAVSAPLALGVILFFAVFTTTLYTLVYRAAAQLADATGGPASA